MDQKLVYAWWVMEETPAQTPDPQSKPTVNHRGELEKIDISSHVYYLRVSGRITASGIPSIEHLEYAKWSWIVDNWKKDDTPGWVKINDKVAQFETRVKNFWFLKSACNYYIKKLAPQGKDVLRSKGGRPRGSKKERQLSSFVLEFPPALKKGTPLGHDGRLQPQDVTHLVELGYDVQHYQQATGPRQVELYLQGCVLGLIDYDDQKFKAVEAMRKHYAKVSKEEAEGNIKQRKSSNPIKLIEKWGTAIGTLKFDGKPTVHAISKVKLEEDQEKARLMALEEVIEKSTEDKIYEPHVSHASEDLKLAVQVAKEVLPPEVLKDLVSKKPDPAVEASKSLDEAVNSLTQAAHNTK